MTARPEPLGDACTDKRCGLRRVEHWHRAAEEEQARRSSRRREDVPGFARPHAVPRPVPDVTVL